MLEKVAWMRRMQIVYSYSRDTVHLRVLPETYLCLKMNRNALRNEQILLEYICNLEADKDHKKLTD
jgi:hypothetical protein